ncbi:hypothetical protein [Pediococcus pentosaceus]|uniref:hypothetical protein n=1 Tax=Pediococcus pentosaceus TaxID=1255 RepID=UPI00207453D3|nr:hypothetical protein [Pediococcus pentosaceus]MCM6820034.1 hypothetical protein [Pediococcus pentosaceus]
MKYSEAEKQIKALSSEYDIDMEDGDFNVVHNRNVELIYVDGYERYKLDINSYYKESFSNMPFSSMLYMILSELAVTPLDERVEEKKKYVKVYDGEFGYLNIDNFTGNMIVTDKFEGNSYKTKFTDKDIEQLKQRDDIPLDWNKVTFEEVEDE